MSGMILPPKYLKIPKLNQTKSATNPDTTHSWRWEWFSRTHVNCKEKECPFLKVNIIHSVSTICFIKYFWATITDHMQNIQINVIQDQKRKQSTEKVSIFLRGYTILQQCVSCKIAPHPSQHVLLYVFGVLATLIDV